MYYIERPSGPSATISNRPHPTNFIHSIFTTFLLCLHYYKWSTPTKPIAYNHRHLIHDPRTTATDGVRPVDVLGEFNDWIEHDGRTGVQNISACNCMVGHTSVHKLRMGDSCARVLFTRRRIGSASSRTVYNCCERIVSREPLTPTLKRLARLSCGPDSFSVGTPTEHHSSH